MKKHLFTLLETVIAIAILALSLTGLFRLLGHSQRRISDAAEDWREMHMLTLGSEYFMLAGKEENLHVPDELFPYHDYLIECIVEDAEGVPEELQNQENQLPLKKWMIKLIRVADRKECRRVIIDRLDYSAVESEDDEVL
ncbi:MAG: type II secretion system protein [Lentisphaeria bacterium]|nr:type II secretion system protein [Lentisphaeria bacterium]